MKRAKRAKPTSKIVESKIYTVKCPHCKTFLTGGFNEEHLRILCFHCKNPIMLDWDYLVNKSKT